MANMFEQFARRRRRAHGTSAEANRVAPARDSRQVRRGKENIVDAEEINNIGFEIVAYSGDARSKLLLALKEAKEGNLDRVAQLKGEAQELLNAAHKSQFELLSREARGETGQLGFIMVHAQDHLMTTMLLADILDTLVDTYRDR